MYPKEKLDPQNAPDFTPPAVVTENSSKPFEVTLLDPGNDIHK
jgi:hypothetical protein